MRATPGKVIGVFIAALVVLMAAVAGEAINIGLPYSPADPILQDKNGAQVTNGTGGILLPPGDDVEVFIPTTTAQDWAYYYLTPEERDVVERVVMAEAGGESRLGQMAVAQCILNACYAEGIRPDEAVVEYVYSTRRPDPSASVKAAVAEVFDEGTMAVDEPILYFYAPALVDGDGHERRHEYVCTIGGHKFFKSKEDK